MKIIKKDLKLTEAVLKEAEDEIKLDDSTEEIANNIQDQAEDAGLKMSDEAAENAAELAKSAGKDLETSDIILADDVALELRNALTDKLDKALKTTIRYKRQHSKEVANVLITGLPGSSKTASVYNWAARTTVSGNEVDADTPEADKIHITYLNAKNNDIEAFINGYTVQDPEDKLSVRQAVSHNLDGLDRPNSVLFLDEYNRQTKAQVRASLLSLINEHYVTGREEGGRHYFKNFLFTVAAINPAGTAEDEGAAMLNDAERSRFLYKVKDFDSMPSVTIEFLKAMYLDKARRLAKTENPDWELIEEFLRIWHLGTFICNHEDFAYDDKSKLNSLYLKQRTMLNQRELTGALAATGGNKDELADFIENDADFLDEDVEDLQGILDDYTVPSLDMLLKAAGITEAPSALDPQNSTNNANTNNSDIEDDEEEDDPDFFNDLANSFNNANGGATVKNPSDAKSTIQGIINGWSI